VKWLFDPAIFNYTLIVLQMAAAVRWWYAGNYAQMIYWVCATGLVWVVTWGMR